MCTVIANCLITFNFNLGVLHTLLLSFMNSFSFMIRIIYIYSNKSTLEQQDIFIFFKTASFIIMNLFILLLSICVIFKTEKEKRKYFFLQQSIRKAKSENDGILSILVPKFVQSKLKTGKFEMADD